MHEQTCISDGQCVETGQPALWVALRLRGGGDDKEDDESGSSQRFNDQVGPYADMAATQAFGDDDDGGEAAEPAQLVRLDDGGAAASVAAELPDGVDLDVL